MRHGILFSIAVVICAVCLAAGAAIGGEVQQQAGYRGWMASWESSNADLGDSILHMLIYSAQGERFGFILLTGFGDGWENIGKFKRNDAQVAATYLLSELFEMPGALRIAAGWHYTLFSTDDDTRAFGEILNGGADITLQGAEIGVSYAYGLTDLPFSVHGSVSFIPALAWDLEEGIGDTGEGDTSGQTMDIGMSYGHGAFTFTGGYRITEVDEDVDMDSNSEIGETFKGVYLQAVGLF